MRSIGIALLVVVSACASSAETTTSTTLDQGQNTTTTTSPPTTSSNAPAPTVESPATEFPPAPATPAGEVEPQFEQAVSEVLTNLFTQHWDPESVDGLVEADDPRAGWLIADLLRFYQGGVARDELVIAFEQITDVRFEPGKVDFVWASDNLIAWDTPAWDGYPEAKRSVYGLVSGQWAQFFTSADIDWRHVTWGGVLPDDRPLGDNGPCSCIPALDNPETTTAAEGDWLDDDFTVFGVVVNNEAIALPKHQMEVHEMVNLSLGGRELGIPYCTLCGSAQAYYVDNVAGHDRLVLRTSGLLHRSNKLMYDLTTGSAIDTFTGEALSGPLAAEDVWLDQVTVVATTWGQWKTAHPDTQILARDGGIGRSYSLDPLEGRDDNGPIFPVGEVDPRLPVQEKVLGVISPDGTPVAFPVASTTESLEEGEIEYLGMTVREEGGIRVYDADGNELVTHQAFWFAWSQFHDGTVVWDQFGS